MRVTICLEVPVKPTVRAAAVRRLFDLPPELGVREQWDAALPLEERDWRVGLVVGPSGCGKTSLARALWPDAAAWAAARTWPDDEAVIEAFPPTLSAEEVVRWLGAVGLSSPPAWLRPYRVLSAGEQCRAALARLLAEAVAEGRDLVVADEFTASVDRATARAASVAVVRAVRQECVRFVSVTCHEDVENWLDPDWVYRPAEAHFAWRELRGRPPLAVDVVRAAASAWPRFAPHHYLSGSLAATAVCFLATVEDRPAAFTAWLPHVGRGPATRREHRTVVLPEYQGLGLGSALAALIASLWTGLGCRARSTTSHPGVIRSRLRGRLWRLVRRPSRSRTPEGRLRHATDRLTASFEYVGPPLSEGQGRALLEWVAPRKAPVSVDVLSPQGGLP